MGLPKHTLSFMLKSLDQLKVEHPIIVKAEGGEMTNEYRDNAAHQFSITPSEMF
jgi:hypothetical protein